MKGDGFDRAVLEVDDVWSDEEEEQDGGDHDVVMEAAALVGPEEVIFEELAHQLFAFLEPGAGLFADDGLVVHVGDQRVRDADGAVGLLVVFKDGEVGAADGEAAAVEGVEELGFLGSGSSEADVGAAGLEGFEVRAGGDLAVEALAREPDFEVVGLRPMRSPGRRCRGAFCGRAARGLRGRLRVLRVRALVGGFGVLGAGELDELHLLELMLADEAADVLAVAAGLGPEAGGEGAEADGEVGFVERFVAEEIGDGDLGGGDEPVVVVGELAFVGAAVVGVEEVFGKLGQLAGAKERAAVDHGGRQDLGVAVLASVEVEHEGGEGSLEAGALAEVDGEAGAGDFGGAFEVEDAEGLADLPVRAWGEGEGRWGAPDFLTTLSCSERAVGNGG